MVVHTYLTASQRRIPQGNAGLVKVVLWLCCCGGIIDGVVVMVVVL